MESKRLLRTYRQNSDKRKCRLSFIKSLSVVCLNSLEHHQTHLTTGARNMAPIISRISEAEDEDNELLFGGNMHHGCLLKIHCWVSRMQHLSFPKEVIFWFDRPHGLLLFWFFLYPLDFTCIGGCSGRLCSKVFHLFAIVDIKFISSFIASRFKAQGLPPSGVGSRGKSAWEVGLERPFIGWHNGTIIIKQ